MRLRLVVTGHAITEYILPIALVAIASITCLGVLAQDLIGGFSSMKPNMAAKNASASAGTSSNPSQASSNNPIDAQPGALGQAATSPVFTSNLQQSIESNGANGTTDMLAAQLTALSKQLLAEGKIDEASANLLQNLANSGHDVASAEKALEDAYVSGSSTVSYNGKTYALTDFTSKQMSFSIFPNGSNIPIVTESTILSSTQSSDLGPVMGNFIGQYQKALNNKALQDPAIKQQVTDLVVKISAIEAAVGFGTESLYGENAANADNSQLLKSKTVSILKDLGQVDGSQAPDYGSNITHGSSATICTANGQGSDSGTHCNN